MTPRYFLIRLVRFGPLVPARLQWLDHPPGEEGNTLDRGRLSPYPFVDIAGAEHPPEVLLERLGIPARLGGFAAPPDIMLEQLDDAAPPLPSHWKYPAPISRAEYDRHLRQLRAAEVEAPQDPRLRPRRRIDPTQLALPNFDRENAK